MTLSPSRSLFSPSSTICAAVVFVSIPADYHGRLRMPMRSPGGRLRPSRRRPAQRDPLLGDRLVPAPRQGTARLPPRRPLPPAVHDQPERPRPAPARPLATSGHGFLIVVTWLVTHLVTIMTAPRFVMVTTTTRSSPSSSTRSPG